MTNWQPIETAPKDGTLILAYYNHDADPYVDPSDEERLTDYAAHAEGGDYLTGAGVTPAKWCEGWHETEDEYGTGFWMPGWWFAAFRDDFDFACNPTHWMPLPPPPQGIDAQSGETRQRLDPKDESPVGGEAADAPDPMPEPHPSMSTSPPEDGEEG